MVTKSAGRDSKELITRAAVRRLLILEVLAIERVHFILELQRNYTLPQQFDMEKLTEQGAV